MVHSAVSDAATDATVGTSSDSPPSASSHGRPTFFSAQDSVAAVNVYGRVVDGLLDHVDSSSEAVNSIDNDRDFTPPPAWGFLLRMPQLARFQVRCSTRLCCCADCVACFLRSRISARVY